MDNFPPTRFPHNGDCPFCAFSATNSKTSGRNYTMDGYAYVSSLDYINFQRETVFTNRNDGWFPFFVYTNDALVLRQRARDDDVHLLSLIHI